MEHIINFLTNQLTVVYIAPFFIAIVTSVGNYVIRGFKDRKRGIPYKVRNKVSVNVFSKYCERNRIQPIISYGDSKALKIVSESDRGDIIVKANIDLKRLPEHNENRNFVMVLLKYIPKCDMTYFYKKGYSFMFDIKSHKGVAGVQLEIKDINGAKVIDEFISVSQVKENYSFKLSDYSECEAWKEISEICFTLFTEKDYITKNTGDLEISKCMLCVK